MAVTTIDNVFFSLLNAYLFKELYVIRRHIEGKQTTVNGLKKCLVNPLYNIYIRNDNLLQLKLKSLLHFLEILIRSLFRYGMWFDHF